VPSRFVESKFPLHRVRGDEDEGGLDFYEAVAIDAFVKSPLNRHTGESWYPEILENTGFRVEHGMTEQGKIDFLQECYNCTV